MTTEIQTQLSLDDLNYFWTSDGIACFYADRENIEEIIESFGFSIYYLICTVQEEKKSATKSTETKGTYTTSYSASSAPPKIEYLHYTSIVKVINNVVGKSVSVVNDKITELSNIQESAVYNLPPIPKILVSKMDEFFRLVHAQHGTESIVILTFDPSCNDSSGWGILVPEQTNTSVHCNYDPNSIVADKPENVLIVGSVHSHPAMAAYASGTDHADQADFDGLHITYGWQSNVNNGATQYHIEMQMGGVSWTLNPEDVFEQDTVIKEADPEVVDWSQKVKKVQPPPGGAYLTSSASLAQNSNKANHQYSREYIRPGIHSNGDISRQIKIPKLENVGKHLIAVELNEKASTPMCPACDAYLTNHSINVRCCWNCAVPLVVLTDSIKDITYLLDWYCQDRPNLYPYGTKYYLWAYENQFGENANKNVLSNIGSYQAQYDILSESANVDVSYYEKESITNKDFDDFDPYTDFDPTITLCCNTPIENKHKCACSKTVVYDDLVDFESSHSTYDIYEYNGDCSNCVYMYTPKCKSYIEAVTDFAVNGVLLNEPIKKCENFLSYPDEYNLQITSKEKI